mgnify:CR=1 FL=1
MSIVSPLNTYVRNIQWVAKQYFNKTIKSRHDKPTILLLRALMNLFRNSEDENDRQEGLSFR